VPGRLKLENQHERHCDSLEKILAVAGTELLAETIRYMLLHAF